jgi:hypothetical protein
MTDGSIPDEVPMTEKRDVTNGDDSQPLPIAQKAENAKRHPEEWVTGDVPMTEAQASALSRLCEDAGEPFDPDLSKAQASQRIDELQARAVKAEPPRILVEEQTDG